MSFTMSGSARVPWKATAQPSSLSSPSSSSYCEWTFLSHEPPPRYHIYHVCGAGDPVGATITVIEDPLQAVKDGAIRLCLAV